MKRILVIRFSSIGDIILTTSVLNSLRKYYPSVRIDFLTLEHFAPLLFNHPVINELLVLPRKSSPGKIREFGRYLDERGYDMIIDLHNTLRSKLIMSRISRTRFKKLKKPRLKRFLLFYLTWNLFDEQFTQLRLLHSPLTGLIDGDTIEPTSLTVTPNEKELALRHLKEKGLQGSYGVCIPGAAWKNKIWPVKNYTDLLGSNVKPDQWVLLGGKGDEICSRIAGRSDKIMDLHGKTDLRESLAILSGAEVVLGSDTGMVHAAEALGIPVVTILGPTSRETGAGVTRSDSKIVERDVWCRPCSQNGKRNCYRKERYCMTGITPDIVSQALNSVLEIK